MRGALYTAAPGWAGIRHRFLSLNQAKIFADYWNYQLHFLWGLTVGVSFCPFEELIAPVPGVEIINLPDWELSRLEETCRSSETVRFRGETLSVFKPVAPLYDRTLAFDLSWDLAATTALEQLVPSEFRSTEPVRAAPCGQIQEVADHYICEHELTRRVGIRVRVTESHTDGRKPRRIPQELEKTVRSIIRLPWYVPVFVVTDSEYIQQTLASHFHDTRFLPKRFEERDSSGRYVNRHDRAAMRTFVTEVACLGACPKIVNIGGFLNDESARDRTIEPPFDRYRLGLEHAAAV
jgi:hypothetical protein